MGNDWNKRTAAGLQKGIEQFQQAIDKDPAYALAFAGLANSYVLLSLYGDVPPRQSFPKAKAAATRALEIDQTLGEAHASLGFVFLVYDWNWPEAEKAFKRALELSPNNATAHHWSGWYLIAMGRFAEAVATLRQVEELDPLSQIIGTSLGGAFTGWLGKKPDIRQRMICSFTLMANSARSKRQTCALT